MNKNHQRTSDQWRGLVKKTATAGKERARLTRDINLRYIQYAIEEGIVYQDELVDNQTDDICHRISMLRALAKTFAVHLERTEGPESRGWIDGELQKIFTFPDEFKPYSVK